MTTRDYPKIVVTPPGPKGEAIIAKDAEYSSTSYIKEYPLVVRCGEGVMVEDVDGNRFLDFMAGIAVASTGYAHPEVVSAVREVAGRLFSMCGTDFYYAEMSDLCERLAPAGPGPADRRGFLTTQRPGPVPAGLGDVRSLPAATGVIRGKMETIVACLVILGSRVTMPCLSSETSVFSLSSATVSFFLSILLGRWQRS